MIVAEFRESIRLTIPQIIAFLRQNDWYIRKGSADALAKLSEQGKVSNLPTQHR